MEINKQRHKLLSGLPNMKSILAPSRSKKFSGHPRFIVLLNVSMIPHATVTGLQPVKTKAKLKINSNLKARAMVARIQLIKLKVIFWVARNFILLMKYHLYKDSILI